MRILGTNLISSKKIKIALTQIYGVGKALSLQSLKKLSIPADKKVCELTYKDFAKLRDYFEQRANYLQGNLKRLIYQNIKRLKDIKCFRGIRHIKGLPVRGQRTRTNSRNARKIKHAFFN